MSMSIEKGLVSSVWQNLHTSYKSADWIDKPSIFAETVIPYLPEQGRIFELGAGVGQDTITFAKRGYKVVSSDCDLQSLVQNIARQPVAVQRNITVLHHDIKEPFPFDDESFDMVYAHLSLHYFNHETTISIIEQAKRVLKSNGIFAFLVNSTDDPEYATGVKLEDDFFKIGEIEKRYFSVKSTEGLTHHFQRCVLDNKGETYKDSAKGVSNLIRFIGKK